MKRFLLMSFCLASLLLLSQWTLADSIDDRILIGRKSSIHSEVLAEDRTYSVYIPPSYANHGEYTHYPVLYLLDGESFFDSFSSTVRYMGSGINANTRFPEMIVVALHNTDRNRDFTPTRSLMGPFGHTQPAYGATGGLPNFLRFMRDELIPHIDKTYRTTRYRLFVGHSLAGLAVVQTLLMAPEMFDAYIAIDPSLWWDNAVTLKTAQQSTRMHGISKKQLFIASAAMPAVKSWGKVDMGIPAVAKAIGHSRSPDLSVTLKHYSNEDHGSVPLAAFIDGVAKIFDGHKISNVTYFDHPERIDMQYEALSNRLGTRLLPTESIMNDMGYWFLTESCCKDLGKALIYFEMNARNYPDSFNAWDSLADATLIKGDKRLAADYYRRSLELNPGNDVVKKKLARIAMD